MCSMDRLNWLLVIIHIVTLVDARSWYLKQINVAKLPTETRSTHAKYAPTQKAYISNEIFATDEQEMPPTSSIMQSAALTFSLTIGAQMAIRQCQIRFQWERWNCPENAFKIGRRDRHVSTREMSYVTAIKAAGIVHSVTRNCSRGDLEGCGCHPNMMQQVAWATDMIGEQWAWGGCSDHVTKGEHVAEQLMTSSERGVDAYTYAYIHNSRVGRNAVRRSVRRACKCHGISGSCTMKTCWIQMGAFPDIGVELMRRYKRAIRVDIASKKGQLFPGNKDMATSSEAVKSFARKSKNELVYAADSPDYCKVNFTIGWPGTRDRGCSKNRDNDSEATTSERRSCRNLCRSCGYQVKRVIQQVAWRCNCSFKWCCKVKCDTCTKTVERYFCV